VLLMGTSPWCSRALASVLRVRRLAAEERVMRRQIVLLSFLGVGCLFESECRAPRCGPQASWTFARSGGRCRWCGVPGHAGGCSVHSWDYRGPSANTAHASDGVAYAYLNMTVCIFAWQMGELQHRGSPRGPGAMYADVNGWPSLRRVSHYAVEAAGDRNGTPEAAVAARQVSFSASRQGHRRCRLLSRTGAVRLLVLPGSGRPPGSYECPSRSPGCPGEPLSGPEERYGQAARDRATDQAATRPSHSRWKGAGRSI